MDGHAAQSLKVNYQAQARKLFFTNEELTNLITVGLHSKPNLLKAYDKALLINGG